MRDELLKFYVNPQWIEPGLGYSPLLFPFFGTRLKKSTPFMSEVWKRHHFDPSYYALVQDIDQADAIFLPHNYWLLKHKRPYRLTAMLREAAALRKPLVIDAYGDSDAAIPATNAVILRTSQYRHKQQPNEIMLPAYVEDLRDIAPASAREKSLIPSIGFAGWADVSRNARIKAVCFRLLATIIPRYGCYVPGVALRKRSLAALASCSGITTNFLLRKTYSGHTKTLQGDAQEIRTQFIENMTTSDYTLNVKGNGNYSQRFYETLSLGRIPLFVDTECVLPLEALVDYRECCVFVNYQDIDRLGEVVAEFHNRLSPEQFVRMQQRARQIFETYLRVDVFTKYLVQALCEKLQALSR